MKVQYRQTQTRPLNNCSQVIRADSLPQSSISASVHCLGFYVSDSSSVLAVLFAFDCVESLYASRLSLRLCMALRTCGGLSWNKLIASVITSVVFWECEQRFASLGFPTDQHNLRDAYLKSADDPPFKETPGRRPTRPYGDLHHTWWLSQTEFGRVYIIYFKTKLTTNSHSYLWTQLQFLF